ncbi:hypothetical protein N7532_010963 [Penicillium argentinense]|uniref:Uncharacterized protein n=1 Tax=Penicillium argentinense TaxID=1131581 RepID=A0A9W9JZ24_9EURO|nr:uncharacterized protein N7532_010963 [Penicillium argentinense]KAJ5086192.1 hypothetical protein N7532_010963 [Penicillium argentinense]
MSVPSSDFNFTFSSGPSPERIFTPSPSQSSSLFGSRSDARTPSSVPSRSSSPASSNIYSQTQPGSIFGEPPPSSTRIFTTPHLPSNNISGSSPNVRMSVSVSARSPPPGFSENTTSQAASGSIFDGPHTTGGRIFAPLPSQSSRLFGSSANARTSSPDSGRSSSSGPSENAGQNPVTSVFDGPQTSGTRIFSPLPLLNNVVFGSRPEVRTYTTVPASSSTLGSSDNTRQTSSGSIFGGSSSAGTRFFTPPPAPSGSIFGSSFTARTSSPRSPDHHNQTASASVFGRPQTSGTRYFTPPPPLSSSPNVGTSTTVPARSSTSSSSDNTSQTASGSIFGGTASTDTRFFTPPSPLSSSPNVGPSTTVPARSSTSGSSDNTSQTASGSIFGGPASTDTRIFTPPPPPSRSADVETSSLDRARSSSPGPSHHDYQTRPICLFSGPPNSDITSSGSGFPAGAGPSTEPSMAPRTPNPRLSVLPSRSMSRDAPALPVHTAIRAGPYSFRPREGGFGAEIGSVNRHPASRATDQSGDTDFSIISPVDEDMHSSNSIEDDLFSPDPIDDQSFQRNFNAVKVQIQELSRVISECPLSQDPGTRLHQIHLEAKQLSEYKDQEPRIVGFIGETGAGKSSVINSILNQRGLARSSGAGGACTSVPMEYRYVDEKHPRPYTIEAEFMDENEVNGLLEELLRSIRRASIPTDRSLVAEEDWAEYEAIGKRSHETLEAIFSDRSDLTIEFLSRPGAETEIEILQELKALALHRLTFRPGGSSSLQYTAVADDLESCKDKLDSLTDSPEESNTPALWPFIKLIRVFLVLPVLKTGLVLADLPGLRDMNHAREISPEESARGTDPHARRMKDMNAEIKKLESKFRRIGRQMQEAQGQRIADLAILDSLEDKIQKLHYERRALLMNQRNDSTKRDLARAICNNQNHKVKDIKVFCIGNELYGNPPHRLAEDYRNLSGVRELRSYCRSVPAEGRMDSALVFIEKQVPALLDSIHQWILTGRDSVTPARARELRSALEQVEQRLRQSFTSGWGHLALTQSELHSQFDTQVMHQLRPSFQREMKEKFVAVSQGWGTVVACFANVQYSPDHSPVAPQAIENLFSLLSHRKGYIIHIFKNALAQVIQETESTKDHTLNGHNNSSLIADLMLEAYNNCSREEGNGSYLRRKNIMRDHLTNTQLYRKYTDSVQSSYLSALDGPFAALGDQLHEQIEMIARDLRGVVVPAGEISEPEKAPELVRELEARIGTLKQNLRYTLAAARR